jgi:hypothetical protein
MCAVFTAVQVLSVRFANFGYFIPQRFDALFHGSRHVESLAKQIIRARDQFQRKKNNSQRHIGHCERPF